MKITKGQKYLCVNDKCQPYFNKGKIYPSNDYYMLIANNGNGIAFENEQTYFQPLSEAKWAVKRTPENADELDRWSGQKWNGEIDIWVTSSKTWSNKLPTDHTEISFETFKEITGMGEEKREFIEDDWVIGWHCENEYDYKTKAWQIGQTDSDYAWVKGQTHHTWYDNLRHATPEEIAAATQQKIFTIEDVRNGKCAIENDGTVEELKILLWHSFPDDITKINGKRKFYFTVDEVTWCEDDVNIYSLPTQSVKIFLSQIEDKSQESTYINDAFDGSWDEKEWQPKWGDPVEVTLFGKKENVIYVSKHPTKSNKHICVRGEGLLIIRNKNLRQLTIHEFTTEQAKEALAKEHNLNVKQIDIK